MRNLDQFKRKDPEQIATELFNDWEKGNEAGVIESLDHIKDRHLIKLVTISLCRKLDALQMERLYDFLDHWR